MSRNSDSGTLSVFSEADETDASFARALGMSHKTDTKVATKVARTCWLIGDLCLAGVSAARLTHAVSGASINECVLLCFRSY